MLRNIFRSDLEQLLSIERLVQALPWTEHSFNLCFQAGCFGWVIEIDKKIIGFIIISSRQQECHILNLCIDIPYQHQGFGKKLLEQALSEAEKQGLHLVYLEVRRSNAKAIALYKKEGFQVVGERKGYYPAEEGHEDALVLAKWLTPLKVSKHKTVLFE